MFNLNKCDRLTNFSFLYLEKEDCCFKFKGIGLKVRERGFKFEGGHSLNDRGGKFKGRSFKSKSGKSKGDLQGKFYLN